MSDRPPEVCPRDHNKDGNCDRHPFGCPSYAELDRQNGEWRTIVSDQRQKIAALTAQLAAAQGKLAEAVQFLESKRLGCYAASSEVSISGYELDALLESLAAYRSQPSPTSDLVEAVRAFISAWESGGPFVNEFKSMREILAKCGGAK